MSDEYSILSNSEEHMVSLLFFVLAPLSMGIAAAIFMVLSQQNSSKSNTFYKRAVQCGKVAALSSILLNVGYTFFCNDLIIGWDYTSPKHMFVTTTESFCSLFYSLIKISFYFGFTFHFQSIVYSYKSERLPLFLRIFMPFVAIYWIIAFIVVIVEDAAVNSNKEIGVTLKHNIYITMLSHDHGYAGFDIVQIISLMLFAIDLLYFAILVCFYAYSLKQMDNESKHKGVKALVLLIISCISFWIFIIVFALNLPFKYVGLIIDYMTDIVCLFLLFDSGTIYDNVCGCLCHNCCGRLFFGANYQAIHRVDDASDKDDAQTDSLL